MLVDAIHALDHHLVLVGKNPEHPAGGPPLGSTGIVAGDDFDNVVFANVHGCAHHPHMTLYDFRGQADNSQEAALAQFPRHGAEDARAPRILFVVDQHQRVAVEAHIAAVVAARALAAAHNDAPDHIAWLDLAAGNGFLDAGNDHITEPRVAPPRAAQNLNAHAFLGARVIGHIQVRIHLNHRRPSFPTPTRPLTTPARQPACRTDWQYWQSVLQHLYRRRSKLFRFCLRRSDARLADHTNEAPVFILGQRSRLHDLDRVAQPRFVLLIVHVANRSPADVLAVAGMLHETRDFHAAGLLHLVAGDNPDRHASFAPFVLGHYVFASFAALCFSAASWRWR